MPVSPCISHPSNGYAWHTHTHSLSKLLHPRGPAFKWNTPNTLCLKSQPAFSPKDGFLPLLPSTQRPSRWSAVWCTALPCLAHGLAGTDYPQPELTHFFRSPRPAQTLLGLNLVCPLPVSWDAEDLLPYSLPPRLSWDWSYRLFRCIDRVSSAPETWLVWRQLSWEWGIYALISKTVWKEDTKYVIQTFIWINAEKIFWTYLIKEDCYSLH